MTIDKDKLDELEEKKAKPEKPIPPEVVPIPEVEEKARAILNEQGQIWSMMNEVLKALIVGEEKNKLVLVLLLAGGEHIFVIAQSSVGKSFVINNVLKLFPDEWVLKRGGMSDKVMQYIDWKGEHANKRIFYLQEFVSVSDEQDKQFRLLSADDGGLIYSVTIRSKETGQFTEQTGTIPPIGFITSTTSLDISDENLTRSWIITPSDNEEQTKAIIQRDNKLGSAPWLRADPAETIMILQECFRLLNVQGWKDKKNRFHVANPFLGLVQFPTTKVRMRRDRSKIERLASIITIVNQNQRPRLKIDNVVYLIGSAGDLKAAIDLTNEIFVETITSLSERHLDVLGTMAGAYDTCLCERKTFEGMTARELTTNLPELSQTTIYKICESLVALGYFLSAKGEGRGTPNIYNLRMVPDVALNVDWSNLDSCFAEWENTLPAHESDNMLEWAKILCSTVSFTGLRENNNERPSLVTERVSEALGPISSNQSKTDRDLGQTGLDDAPDEAKTIILSSSEVKHMPEASDKSSEAPEISTESKEEPQIGFNPEPFLFTGVEVGTRVPSIAPAPKSRPDDLEPSEWRYLKEHDIGDNFEPAANNFNLVVALQKKGYLEEEHPGFWRLSAKAHEWIAKLEDEKK